MKVRFHQGEFSKKKKRNRVMPTKKKCDANNKDPNAKFKPNPNISFIRLLNKDKVLDNLGRSW